MDIALSRFGAGRYALFPTCEARIVQVPAAIAVTVGPLTAHTDALSDAKVTASPDDAVATTLNGGVPYGWVEGAVKLMD